MNVKPRGWSPGLLPRKISVQFCGGPYWICSGKSDYKTGFSPVNGIFFLQQHSTNASRSICMLLLSEGRGGEA